MDGPIIVTFEPTVAEGATVIRRHLLDSHAMMAALIGFPTACGALTWWATDSRMLGLGVLGFFLGLMGTFSLVVRPRAMAEDIADGGLQHWEFDEQHVRIGHELGVHLDRPWARWNRAVLYDDLIVLYRDDRQCVFFPRRAFREGDYDALFELIERKLGRVSKR